MLGIEGSDDEAPTYIGEQALRVTCVQRTDGSRYVLRRPMKRGRIDFGSLGTEAVMCELQVGFRETCTDHFRCCVVLLYMGRQAAPTGRAWTHVLCFACERENHVYTPLRLSIIS
jgi:hypothetical protein